MTTIHINTSKLKVECNVTREMLSLYIDGELLDIEKEILKTHLKECKDCSKELNQLKILDWDLRNEDQIEIPYELITIRKQVIDDNFDIRSATNKSSKRNLIYNQQQNSIKQMTRFIGLMPGSKLVKKTGNKVGTTINQQISNASKKLLKKMIGF